MEPILSDKPAQIDIESAANSTWQYRSSANDVNDDDDDDKDQENESECGEFQKKSSNYTDGSPELVETKKLLKRGR